MCPDPAIATLRRTAWYHPLVAIFALWAALVVLALPGMAHAAAATGDVEFNVDFLQSSGTTKADISRFSKDNVVTPGDYLVDLRIDGDWRERLNVHFAVPPGGDSAKPCLTWPVLMRVGLNLSAIPPDQRPAPGAAPERNHWFWPWHRHKDPGNPATCVDIERLVPGAAVSFNLATLTLSLSLPQAVLRHRPHGYVSPQSWNKGVPSLTLAYDANVFHTTYSGISTTSVFAGLTAGANLGDWHFRDRSTLSGTNGHWTFQNIAAYVERDLPALQSGLTVGDTFTDGAVFDSMGFRGVSLGTDDRMRPDSMSGYAPVVRGIARTNARVRITQHGAVLLETTVAPGAFEITDLYPTGYGGDLLVTVYESDGSQQSFTVSYASLVQLLRPHVWRYSVAAGDLQINNNRTRDRFFQGALQHGISDALTTYAGGQLSEGYRAALIGTALNTPLGGFALDATLARTALPPTNLAPSQVRQGYSVRLSYSKIVPGIRTNIALSAYRYSSGGFWSLQDAEANRDAVRANAGLPITDAPTVAGAIMRQHSRFQINVAQNLPKHWGNLYLNGSTTRYYGNGSVDSNNVTQFQAGYNNVANLGKMNVNYGLALSRQRDDVSGRIDKRMLFNLSFALGQKPNSPRVTVNLANDRGGEQASSESQTSGQVAVTGTLGINGEVSYGADVNFAPGDNAVSLNGAYRAQFGTLTAGGSVGTGFKEGAFGISGGIVVHPGGVTMTSMLGDTIAIADAPGAKGASVATGTGTRINGAGYAVVPYLLPYRENEVAIDPHGTSMNIEMQVTSQQVAPHANAVVMLHFPTTIGTGVMFQVHMPDGTPVPFGASVSVPHQPDAGIAGQNGQIFLRGITPTGRVQVTWGAGTDAHCGFDYTLPKPTASAPLIRINSTCLPN